MSDVRQILIHSVRDAIGPNWPLWILAGVGLFTCFLNRSTGKSTGFLLGLLISSILAVCPGFYFRSHYFILLLPAVALFAGVAVNNISSVLRRQITAVRFFPILLLASCIAFLVYGQRDLFFRFSPVEISHTIYAGNLFPETIKVAEYVRDHHGPFRHHRGVRIGASDLLLLPPSFRDRLHLHLSAHGAADICAPDAKRNDS